MYKKIYLKKGKEESLQRFHPWVFSGAIAKIESGVEEGDIVQVFTHEKEFVAVGHYQIGSIAVRVLSFDDIIIDESFWEKRLQVALDVRKAIGVVGHNSSSGFLNTTYRLVHGEGDNLPGLVVDVYDKTCVVQAHSVGMHVNRYDISNAIVKVFGEQIDSIYYKSDTTLPFNACLRQENGFLYGKTDKNDARDSFIKLTNENFIAEDVKIALAYKKKGI